MHVIFRLDCIFEALVDCLAVCLFGSMSEGCCFPFIYSPCPCLLACLLLVFHMLQSILCAQANSPEACEDKTTDGGQPECRNQSESARGATDPVDGHKGTYHSAQCFLDLLALYVCILSGVFSVIFTTLNPQCFAGPPIQFTYSATGARKH